MIPLEQEIDFLKSYLRLELMRFPDKFDYSISCCEGDAAAVIFLLPVLVQLFAENAIRHGFVNLRRKGHLSVEFKKEGKDLIKCTITDNGIGREKARLKNEPAQKSTVRTVAQLPKLASGYLIPPIRQTDIKLFTPTCSIMENPAD